MGISPEELARIVAAHGGQIGAVPVDPTVTSKIGSTSMTEDNPNPQFRLILRDGTTITVRSAGYGPNGEVTDWDVTDPGTAMKQATAAQSKPDPWENPQDGSVTDLTTGKPLSGPIPGWQPGLGVRWPQQAPQRAPRYPDEERMAQLNIQKAERELQDPFTNYQQEMERAIDAITQQRAAGKISAAEADRLMMLARQNGEAALRGTTPWQIQKQTEDTARDTLNTSLSAKSNMSQGLLTGLGGIYGKILQSSNPPLNFDPMAMASSAVDAWGYGPEADAKARDIVRGLLSGSRGF